MTMRSTSFIAALFAAALELAMPVRVIAGSSVTYRCEGDQITEAALRGAPIKEHVVRYYTIELSKTTGRYWDWTEHLWRPILSVDSHILVLADETVGPGLHAYWRATIDRDTGAWSVLWTGGQHSTNISGQCKRSPLREPPG